jgi:hypothetical protein
VLATGQAARELGTSLALIRVLCETHVIPAETTPGGHLRVSASVVERLKREGLPQVPRPLPTETSPPPRDAPDSNYDHPDYPAEQSDDVAYAADQVEITRSNRATSSNVNPIAWARLMKRTRFVMSEG